VIPKDWEVRSLGEIASLSSGGTPTRQNSSYWSGDIPWITTTLIDFNMICEANEFITSQGLENSAARVYNSGTLLMAMYGQGKTRGKIAILGIDAAINQACVAIEPVKTIASEYVFFNLAARYEEIRGLSNIGNQENLNVGIIESILLPIPPTLEEQRAIAEVLSDVDALIAALDRLIAKKRAIKQGAMQQLLSGQTRLPGFSGEWEIKSILELTDGKKELFDDGDWIEAEFLTEDGVRLVQTGNIGEGHFLDKESKKYISLDSFRQLGCKEVRPGDILICRLAEPAGRACILPDIDEEKVITAVDVSIFRPMDSVADRRYLVNVFCTPEWFNEVQERCGGTTRSRIARSELGKIKFSLPPLPEQRAIATVLSDMDAEIAALEARREKTRALKQGMMQELLTGRIRLVGE